MSVSGSNSVPNPPRHAPSTSANTPSLSQHKLVLVVLSVLAVVFVFVRWGDGFVRTRPSEVSVQNPQQKINLNHADKKTLMTLPGVGSSTADAIISHRQQHGPFQNVEGLTAVPGIKQATLGKLSPYLTVGLQNEKVEPKADNNEPDILIRKKDKVTSTSKGAIKINTATQAEIETLPGIGPVLAKSIIAERDKKSFTKLEDLRKVPGIGPKRFDQIRELVVID